eukprot:5346951-Pleurochrysis_carterae.AAC.1
MFFNSLFPDADFRFDACFRSTTQAACTFVCFRSLVAAASAQSGWQRTMRTRNALIRNISPIAIRQSLAWSTALGCARADADIDAIY